MQGQRRQPEIQVLSGKDVARMCRVRTATALSWLASGQLPAIRNGSRWMVLSTDLLQFLSEQARRQAADRREQRATP